MGGIVSIGVTLFGLLWTFLVVSSGGGIFGLFGLIFVGIGIANTVYNFKNATGKNRYSEFDITENGEEPDPWNERFGTPSNADKTVYSVGNSFCPYCGQEVQKDFEFCNNCGRKLPD